MRNARDILEKQFLKMRWRCLSLAADFDRIERAQGAEATMADPRIADLKKGLKIILDGKSNRAEQFLMLMSDQTPPPKGNPQSP